MKKTILLLLVILLLIMIAGYNIVRNTLVSSINNRMDSSEALIINEINGRLHRDFSKNISPSNIEYSPNSFSYNNEEGDLVTLSNEGDFIKITINHIDSTKWESKTKGNIEVAEIREVHIPSADIIVDVLSTSGKLYAITYRIAEDFSKKRISLNREFTSYFSVIDE